MKRSRPGFNGVLALALGVPVAIISLPTHGQGTSGTVPDPISSRALARYMEELDLTDEQTRAIESLHEGYREEFRALRSGEIEELLQQIGGMWRGGFSNLDREGVQEAIKQTDRVMSRIRGLDDRFFDELQGVLGEDQLAELPRIIQARERDRYRSGATRMIGYVNPGARIDLGRTYRDLELGDQERRATEPLIVQYEMRLTNATRSLYEATTRVFLDVVDALQAQNVNFADAADPESRRQMMQGMRTAWAEALQKPRDKASAISDLNRRTLYQVTELLPAEPAATFKERYLRRAYPQVPSPSQGGAASGYRAALALEGLSREMQADVKAAAEQFRSQSGRLIEEMISYLDDYRREYTPTRFRGPQRREHEAKLEGYRERLTELDERAVEALYALLGSDLAGEIKLAVASGSFGSDEAAGATVAPWMARPETATLEPDPFVPPAISARDVVTYRKRLDLAEHDGFIAESLHEDYAIAYSAIRDTDIRDLRMARTKLGSNGAEAGAAPTAGEIDEFYSLQKRVVTSIRELDDSFFDDLGTVITSKEQTEMLKRLRLARERRVYNRGLGAVGPEVVFGARGGDRRGRSFMRRFMSRSRESGVDVAALTDRLELTPSQRAEANEILLEYEKEAAEAFRRQYDTVLDLRAEAQKRTASSEPASGENDRERRRQEWRNLRRYMDESNRRLDEVGKPIVELNRSALDLLCRALPESTAAALRHAYNRRAFPSVYEDPRSAERYLSAAVKLPNLAEGQEQKISSIIEEYRPAYRKLGDEMAEIQAAAPDPGASGERSRWRGGQERRNQLDVLRFDRDEVNAKAMRHLREVLTERQQALIGLPAPQGDQPNQAS